MRIGVDAACWANPRGYGRYARELVSAMAASSPGDEFICFLDDRAAARFELDRDNVRRVGVRAAVAPTEAASAEGHRSLTDMLRFSRAVWRERPDVFFSPSVYTYFPLPPRQPAVVAIHDAIADRFPELTLPTRRSRLFWRAKVSLAIRQARLILTVSDFARDEIVEVLNVRPERLRVATEAPASAYRPEYDRTEIAAAAAAYGLPAGARWFTYVGGFNPHKNVEALVEAHARLATGCVTPPYLLLVGPTDEDRFHGSLRAIRDAIERAGTAGLVRWAGYVPDEDLRKLHSGALALALLSENEGFGLPAVEAAACACPVIATVASPLPRLLAGGGFFVAPGDIGAALAAMDALLADDALRARLGQVALRRAQLLSWRLAAEVALDTLREAAA